MKLLNLGKFSIILAWILFSGHVMADVNNFGWSGITPKTTSSDEIINIDKSKELILKESSPNLPEVVAKKEKPIVKKNINTIDSLEDIFNLFIYFFPVIILLFLMKFVAMTFRKN